MENISNIGWLVLGVVALIVATFVFIIAMRKGFKAGIGDKTIEVTGSDGEKQSVDTYGLMYIMNDNCRQIEQRKKERIDGIIPDLAYRLSDISSTSCLVLLVESILQARRRKNGFEKLVSAKLFGDYCYDVSGEIIGKVKKESLKVVSCSKLPVPDINEAAVKEIVFRFTHEAVLACVDEYKAKSTLYTQFVPLYQILKDKTRMAFCTQKIAKHDERVKEMEAMIAKIEGAE